MLYELIGLHGTPHGVYFLIIAIDEKESRVSRHAVLGAERSAFLLLHIQFDGYKVLVEKITHASIREYAGSHVFAGATPYGISVDEDELVLAASLGQCFFPAALKKFDADAGTPGDAGQDKYDYKPVAHKTVIYEEG